MNHIPWLLLIGKTVRSAGTTHRLLDHDFECQPSGVIEVKGKGPMNTWYLVGENHTDK
jgi:hypothetical protein